MSSQADVIKKIIANTMLNPVCAWIKLFPRVFFSELEDTLDFRSIITRQIWSQDEFTG